MPASTAFAPRKRPTQVRSTATVGVILETAARILEAEGLEGFTTNAVAARAGVSVGSLYQYFPGKAALAAALIERETASLLEDVLRAEALGGFERSLDAMIAAAITYHMRRPALSRVLDFIEDGLPPEVRPSSSALFTAAIVRVLSRRLKQPAASEAGGDLLAIMRGVCDFAGARGGDDGTALRRRLHRAVYGYLRGMA